MIVCGVMLTSQLAVFAEENDSGGLVDEKEESEWGNSDGIQLHFDVRHDRKKFYLDRGYRGFVSAEILIGKNSGHGYSTTHGLQLNERYFIGAGIGFDMVESDFDLQYYIPIYSDFRVDFNGNGVSPFLDVRGGYSLETYEEPGFYADVSFGCRLRRASFSLGVETLPGFDCYPSEASLNYRLDKSNKVESPSRIWNVNVRFAFEFDKHKN